MSKILGIGTEIKPYGEIVGVCWKGERYYMLIDKQGTVSLMPADHIETIWGADGVEKPAKP